MTLQKAKDIVALMNGERSWEDWGRRISEPYGHSIPEIHMDEVAELYGRSKWDEACKCLRQKIELNWVACEMDRNEEYKVIVDTTNPEFKP